MVACKPRCGVAAILRGELESTKPCPKNILNKSSHLDQIRLALANCYDVPVKCTVTRCDLKAIVGTGESGARQRRGRVGQLWAMLHVRLHHVRLELQLLPLGLRQYPLRQIKVKMQALEHIETSPRAFGRSWRQ